MCRINPRVDFAFKKLFGSEENTDILLPFINAVLPPHDQIVSLELKNPYNLQDYASDKLSILDIRAIDNSGRHITIEMQIADHLDYERRALFCWSDVYAKQLGEGDSYSELKKTIAIHVLNFNLMDEPAYHNIYKIKNLDTNSLAFDDFQIHTIELKKFTADLSHLTTSLDRWVTFLTKANQLSKSAIPTELAKEPGISKAISVLDTINLNEDERTRYEDQLKWLRDEESIIRTAQIRGEERGIAKGKIEGKREGQSELIHTMHQSGLSVDEISQFTGLATDQIQGFLKNANSQN